MQAEKDTGVIEKVLHGTGRGAIIVVGSAAKFGWKATKFTGNHIAKPLIKVIFAKAAQAAGKYLLRRSRFAAKHALPIAAKYALL